jgi:dephospho-CoA kinase
VGNPVKKPVIGILGGICSGKSTVAAEFAKLGCKVIDADEIAKKLIEKRNIKEKIAASFGQNILNRQGKIDRRKLAGVVFSDGNKLSLLNSIVHPPVLTRIEQLIKRYNRQKRTKAIVLDMPLLAEVGWASRCNRLIFVDCKQKLRLKRAKKKGIFNRNQLKKRENFQISLDRKTEISDNTISNNSGFRALAKQVVDIFSCIVDNG